jgi:hypothetical protein
VCDTVGDTVTSRSPAETTPGGTAPADRAAATSDTATGRSPGAGSLLAGRYRLHRPVAHGETCTVWIADDTVLERRVAVKVLREDGDHGAVDGHDPAAFLERARLAARVEHPAITTTFDTGRDGCLFTVAELAAGSRLDDVVAARGPVSPACAVGLARQLADALVEVERCRVAYGGVDLDDVVVSPGDALTLTGIRACAAGAVTDVDLEAGLAVTTSDAPEPEIGPVASVAVGTALYTLLGGRRPVRNGGGAVMSPRQLRADIPRVLDELTMRALGGAFPSASSIARALADLPPLEEPVTGPVTVLSRPPRIHRDTVIVGGVLLVAVLALVVGLLFTSEGGRTFIRAVVPDIPVINPSPRTESSPAPTTATASEDGASIADEGPADVVAAPRLGSAVTVVGAHDYDPLGDGAESTGDVPFLVDGDVATSWSSEQYENPDFGNLKSGLGIRLDVPPGTEVAGVRIHSAEGGWAAVVMVADAAAESPDEWGPVRAQVAAAQGGVDELAFDRPGSGSVALVWFTRLPPSGDLVVSEIEVLAPAASSADGA